MFAMDGCGFDGADGRGGPERIARADDGKDEHADAPPKPVEAAVKELRVCRSEQSSLFQSRARRLRGQERAWSREIWDCRLILTGCLSGWGFIARPLRRLIRIW